MPKIALETPYLDLLPQPPALVDDHLFHWCQWLRFLPYGGPRQPTMCASIEREYYLQITRKLQSQYHPAEPDERLMYDWRKGERMEKAIHELPEKRRDSVIWVHWKHIPIPKILRGLKFKDEQAFHMELTGAYRQLAGKLCD